MRTRSSPYAISIGVGMAAAWVAGSAGAAPTDACALLSQAQMSAALGVPMGAGTYVTPGFLKTCTWQPASGATPAIKAFTLYLQSAASFDGGKNMLQLAQTGGAANGVTRLSGVGDDAYYASFGPNITSLLVKKGDGGFKLTLYGATAPDKVKAIEKALASQVLAGF